jgi:subtilase family serine protease
MNGDIACTASFEGAPDLQEFLVWAPTSTRAGTAFTAVDLTLNLGTASAKASNTRLYLSTDAAHDASDRPLAVRSVPPLPTPGASLGVLSVVIPVGTAPGSYYLVAVADADRTLSETIENNNVATRALVVR